MSDKKDTELKEVKKEVKEEEHSCPKNFTEQNVAELYDALNNMLKDGKLNVLDTARVVVHLMQIVEDYDNLKGEDKKALLIYVVKKYDESHPDEDNIFTEALPGFIDTLVYVDRGKLSYS